MQYTLPIKALDIFIRADVFNIFNEQDVVSFDEEDDHQRPRTVRLAIGLSF